MLSGSSSAGSTPGRAVVSDDIFDDKALEAKLDEMTLPVRKGPEKIGLTFSARAMPGVPARDRPDREPPKPKGKIQRPKLHGEDDHLESDPVFLKGNYIIQNENQLLFDFEFN